MYPTKKMAFKQGQYVSFISEIPNSAFPPSLVKDMKPGNWLLPLIGDEGKVTKRIYGGWYKIYMSRNGCLITIRNGEYMVLKSKENSNSSNSNKEEMKIDNIKYEGSVNGEDHLILDLQQENEALKLENLAKKNFISGLEEKLAEMKNILSDYEYQTNVNKEKLLKANEEITNLKKENHELKSSEEKNVHKPNDHSDTIVRIQKDLEMVKKLIELNSSSVPWYDKQGASWYDDHN